MKKITLLLALVLAISFANAQDNNYNNNEVRTIFSGGSNNGGFGALSLGYTEIDGSDAFIGGVRGGFIFDQKLAIGLGGYGFVNNLDNKSYHNSFNRDMYLAGGYGGVFIEPIVAGNSPVHVSFPILLGIGGVALTNDDWNWDWEDDNYHSYNYDSDVFFVFEPGVELEFNLARFFRMAAAVSYRITSDIELTDVDEVKIDYDALQGLNFALVFKFGKF